jgi:flagellar hook-associated protein 1 FlgK
MGLIDTSLQIGRSALLSQSLAMDVVGNNIANATTEGYARQVVDLRSAQGVRTPEGAYLGPGVNAENIRRISDFYLEQRLRDARSSLEDLKSNDESYGQIEGIFNELTDNDLSSAMNSFFTALNNVQANPEERSVRTAAVESAKTFTEAIRGLRDKLDQLRANIDSEVTGSVSTVNSITQQLAEINVEISRLEAGGAKAGSATALRDRRDLLLGQLSDIIEIRTVEQPNGMVNVFAGSDPLVMDNQSYDLKTETRMDHGLLVSDVVFSSDSRPVDIRGGRLKGLIDARDKGCLEFIDGLDAWSAALVDGFNRIHSSGQGLDLYQGVSGTNGVDDPDAALNAAGLDYTPQSGAFEVAVKNRASGETKTFRFIVDLDGLGGNDTTLTSLVADINSTIGGAFPEIGASVGAGNTLKISSSAPDVSFSFSNDTSGALACLGVNTFFTGSDSKTISINPLMDESPGYLAAASTGMPGDNANITKLLAFQQSPVEALGGASIDSYYRGIVSTLGIRAASAQDRHTGGQAIFSAIQSQREALSGVSIDEEAVKLIRYQSGYTAAARFITTIDEMIKTLLSM